MNRSEGAAKDIAHLGLKPLVQPGLTQGEERGKGRMILSPIQKERQETQLGVLVSQGVNYIYYFRDS